jgi:putative endonuclease
MLKYYVYILLSTFNRHYIGYSSNLAQRIAQHNRKHHGFTYSNDEKWELVCFIECNDKPSAMKLEKYLKSLKNPKLAIEYIHKSSQVEHPDF